MKAHFRKRKTGAIALPSLNNTVLPEEPEAAYKDVYFQACLADPKLFTEDYVINSQCQGLFMSLH